MPMPVIENMLFDHRIQEISVVYYDGSPQVLASVKSINIRFRPVNNERPNSDKMLVIPVERISMVRWQAMVTCIALSCGKRLTLDMDPYVMVTWVVHSDMISGSDMQEFLQVADPKWGIAFTSIEPALGVKIDKVEKGGSIIKIKFSSGLELNLDAEDDENLKKWRAAFADATGGHDNIPLLSYNGAHLRTDLISPLTGEVVIHSHPTAEQAPLPTIRHIDVRPKVDLTEVFPEEPARKWRGDTVLLVELAGMPNAMKFKFDVPNSPLMPVDMTFEGDDMEDFIVQMCINIGTDRQSILGKKLRYNVFAPWDNTKAVIDVGEEMPYELRSLLRDRREHRALLKEKHQREGTAEGVPSEGVPSYDQLLQERNKLVRDSSQALSFAARCETLEKQLDGERNEKAKLGSRVLQLQTEIENLRQREYLVNMENGTWYIAHAGVALMPETVEGQYGDREDTGRNTLQLVWVDRDGTVLGVADPDNQMVRDFPHDD